MELLETTPILHTQEVVGSSPTATTIQLTNYQKLTDLHFLLLAGNYPKTYQNRIKTSLLVLLRIKTLR
jgi:hypothetical protein